MMSQMNKVCRADPSAPQPPRLQIQHSLFLSYAVVAFGESIESAVSGKQKIEGSSGSKKVAITVSGVSVSTQSKKKANKKKLNSVSGTNNSVIY